MRRVTYQRIRRGAATLEAHAASTQDSLQRGWKAWAGCDWKILCRPQLISATRCGRWPVPVLASRVRTSLVSPSAISAPGQPRRRSGLGEPGHTENPGGHRRRVAPRGTCPVSDTCRNSPPPSHNCVPGLLRRHSSVSLVVLHPTPWCSIHARIHFLHHGKSSEYTVSGTFHLGRRGCGDGRGTRGLQKGSLAEAVGFEPTMPLQACLISSQVQSTTLPCLRTVPSCQSVCAPRRRAGAYVALTAGNGSSLRENTTRSGAQPLESPVGGRNVNMWTAPVRTRRRRPRSLKLAGFLLV